MWGLVILFIISNIFTPTTTSTHSQPADKFVLDTLLPFQDVDIRPMSSDSQFDTSLNFNHVYDGCGETKTCFGLPNNCIENRNCLVLSTIALIDDRFTFELLSGANNAQYVSVALSTDQVMGDDAGMECLPDGGNIHAYSSWVIARPNLGGTRIGVSQEMIEVLNTSFVDGLIYCKFERDSVSTVLDKEFDLINRNWYLLLAVGTSLDANAVGFHDLGQLASTEAIDLGLVTIVTGRSAVLLRLHGAFMLVAWIGTASIGMLMARYFKQTFVGSTLFGKDQWFQWHQILMVLTWLLTIVGFILIFVEIRGWSAADNPHAILGTITTGLCFIQPFMAVFRPGPKDRMRPVFNWAHWAVGNVAHVLAIVTIFFAVTLNLAQLPQWYDWILVAFVAFHAVMHFVFSIAADETKKEQARLLQKPEALPQTNLKENGHKEPAPIVEQKKDAPYSPIRIGLLGIYILVVLMFMVALVVIASIVPI